MKRNAPFRAESVRARYAQCRSSAFETCERLDDGRALFTAVCQLGFEGVVAKNHSSLYRPNDCGWVRSKIRTTGGATPDERRWCGSASVGRELASNSKET
jgi:ATP-dependent DNA ligase